jgi:excisionase family DNA binding protein
MEGFFIGGYMGKRAKWVEVTELVVRHIQSSNELLARLVELVEEPDEDCPPSAAFAGGSDSGKEFLTVDEAASVSGYSKGYVYQLIHAGQLAYSKPCGGRVFIARADLAAFLGSKRIASSAELALRAAELLDAKGRMK